MVSVQIQNVPDEVCAVLRQRAAAANQSLQEYLLTHLIAFTAKPTLEQVLGSGWITIGRVVDLRAGSWLREGGP